MKRLIALTIIIVILLAACLPSAFCVAEPDNAARFGELLTQLDGVSNYADIGVQSLVVEAEALVDDADVVAAYTAEQRAMVPEFRRRYERDVLLMDIAYRVQENTRQVKLSAEDTRTFAKREWAQILSLYTQLTEDIAAAPDKAAMQTLWQQFLDAVRALPVEEDIYNAWETAVNKVVQAKADVLFGKVNDYRLSLGLHAIYGPVFIVACLEDSLDEFALYTAANLLDGAAVNDGFTAAVNATVQLGLYATEAEMEAQWQGYDAAVQDSKPTVSQQEMALHEAIVQAEATLRQAIADSDYVQSLKGADAELYATLPDMMMSALAYATSLQEVDEILADYLALLDPSAMGNEKGSRLGTLNIVIIVTACLSVLLFAAYFILRIRHNKEDSGKRSSEMVLAEMMALAKQHDKDDAVEAADSDADNGMALVGDFTQTDEAAPAEPSAEEQIPEASEEGAVVVPSDGSANDGGGANPADNGDCV